MKDIPLFFARMVFLFGLVYSASLAATHSGLFLFMTALFLLGLIALIGDDE